MRAWEKRLSDLWQLLKQCHETYMEPDLFRLNINQFLQTSRTVTFIIQKHKDDIKNFNAWYQPLQAQWGKDKLMTWAKDSRNVIEKEGDLELHSSLNLTLFFSYIEEQDAKISIGRAELLHAGTKMLVRLAQKKLPSGVEKSSAIKIERRWVANSLPDHELLQIFAYIYNDLYQTCASLAEFIGSKIDPAIHGVSELHSRREEARQVCYLKLSDLKIHYQKSSTVDNLSDSKIPQELRQQIREISQNLSKGDNDIDKLFNWLKLMAEKIFHHDGYHESMLFHCTKDMKNLEMIQMSFADRVDKYIFWRSMADRVSSDKTTLIATIGEAWLRQEGSLQDIDKMKIVGERLMLSALDSSGSYRSAEWEIVRKSSSEKPVLRYLCEDESLSGDKLPTYYAPVLKALHIPYPSYFTEGPTRF